VRGLWFPGSRNSAWLAQRQRCRLWQHNPRPGGSWPRYLRMRLRSLPEWGMNRSPSSIGVLIGVVRGPRGDGRGVAPTAFEWAYASWDNAKGVVPCGSRIGRQAGDESSALATRSAVTSAPLRTAILARPQRTVSRLHNL
jgi:hypothetical protein